MNSDIFILPSEHEGFCVPVLEALSQGCRVITYDNSNLKFIGGGLTTLVPTKSIQKLFEAVEKDIILIKTSEWKEKKYNIFLYNCSKWINQFNEDNIKKMFIDYVIN